MRSSIILTFSFLSVLFAQTKLGSDISGSGGTAITIDPTADLAEQTHCIRNPNWPRIINGTNYSGRITAKPLNKPHIQSTRSLGRFNGDMVSDNFV